MAEYIENILMLLVPIAVCYLGKEKLKEHLNICDEQDELCEVTIDILVYEGALFWGIGLLERDFCIMKESLVPLLFLIPIFTLAMWQKYKAAITFGYLEEYQDSYLLKTDTEEYCIIRNNNGYIGYREDEKAVFQIKRKEGIYCLEIFDTGTSYQIIQVPLKRSYAVVYESSMLMYILPEGKGRWVIRERRR